MKLTNSQHAVLSAAADHPSHRIEHFPENLKGAARTKVRASLIAHGLIRQKGKHQALTKTGFAALGRERPALKRLLADIEVRFRPNGIEVLALELQLEPAPESIEEAVA
jgi:hypothetical protein